MSFKDKLNLCPNFEPSLQKQCIITGKNKKILNLTPSFWPVFSENNAYMHGKIRIFCKQSTPGEKGGTNIGHCLGHQKVLIHPCVEHTGVVGAEVTGWPQF